MPRLIWFCTVCTVGFNLAPIYTLWVHKNRLFETILLSNYKVIVHTEYAAFEENLKLKFRNYVIRSLCYVWLFFACGALAASISVGIVIPLPGLSIYINELLA